MQQSSFVQPNMWDGYTWFQDIKECYAALYDVTSRELFASQMLNDLGFDPMYVNQMALVENRFADAPYGPSQILLQQVIANKQRMFVYGIGNYGKKWCEYLQSQGANLVGFFDRGYQDKPTCFGLPVLPPPVSTEGFEDCCVLVTPVDFIDSICEALRRSGFSEEQIFRGCPQKQEDIEHQYFDFPDKYPKGGAFVDAGCFDCGTSLRFVRWCQGAYSKIFAFEPDAQNLERCRQVAREHDIQNIEFYQAGLYDCAGQAGFSAGGTSSSRLDQAGDTAIPLVTLDEIVGDTVVSFLKMDIEGAEAAALRGAAHTIRRDRPLCAISAYHKPGDVLVLMQYLKNLVPEYQFALRHYSNIDSETVLYAFL